MEGAITRNGNTAWVAPTQAGQQRDGQDQAYVRYQAVMIEDRVQPVDSARYSTHKRPF